MVVRSQRPYHAFLNVKRSRPGTRVDRGQWRARRLVARPINGAGRRRGAAQNFAATPAWPRGMP